ncbi:MAG TPA: hypothetical protein VN946_07885 [Terriglobales bacterium]|nr:hypothetical protein [Terriglobales bacterium]
MRRVHFIEIHEQPWVPSSIRDGVTDALQFGLNFSKPYAPIFPMLQSALDLTGRRAVVDLCSGGGGPWLELSRQLRVASPDVQIWLTDKYPNLGALQRVNTASDDHLSYYRPSVDATKVPLGLKGLRTMFTSFHHFSPEEAHHILQNAVDAGEGIGIFEVTRRALSTIGIVSAWVLMLFVCTPWIRPFRWSRLLWTFLVPIIPVVLLFDGVVSCLRTYQPQELREMVDKLTAGEYEWEIGEYVTGRVPVTYLIGCPRALSREFIQ